MSNIELKHKWSVNPDSWFIRLYLRTWDASAHDINFCKLFWGFVFMIPAWLILRPLFAIGTWIESKLPDKKPLTMAQLEAMHKAQEEAAVAKREAPPSRMQRVLTSIADFFVRVHMLLQSIAYRLRWLKHLKVPLLYLVLGLTLITMVGVFGWVIYLLTTIGWDVWVQILKFVGAMFATAIVALVVLLFITTNAGKKTGKVAKRGTLGFFGVMKQGFIAVKSNTCPEIILEEKN